MATRALLAAMVGLAMVGCGAPGGGLLLTPVPADKRLEETDLRSDPGWFIMDKIVIVDAEGLLANAEMGPMFGQKENPVSLFTEKLQKARDDADVKGVIVRINSPGGTVAASDIMHRELLAFRKARPDVRVAALILDVGASGGYYLACGAEKIYAMPSSLTGSIGVIFQTFSLQGMLAKIGVTTDAITSGKNKDMASPLRDRNAEELKILHGLVDNYYQTFLGVVLEGRKNSAVKVTRETLTGGEAPLADGRVFTGNQAQAVGLVDEVLYPEQVIARVKKDANITRGKVVIYGRPLGYKGTIYAGGNIAPAGAPSTVNLLNVDLSTVLDPRQPKFLYLWTTPQP